jgi:hypothetical protein
MRRIGEGCLLWVVVLLLVLLFPSVVLLIVNEVLHLVAVVLARLLEMASHVGSGSGGGPGAVHPTTTLPPLVGGSGGWHWGGDPSCVTCSAARHVTGWSRRHRSTLRPRWSSL